MEIKAVKKIGLIVVGNEILSGKREDKHVPAFIRILSARGLALNWVRVVGDDLGDIAQTITETRSGDTIVFCCGGIGATPDDVTRQAAAKAFGRPIQRHLGAVAEIEAQYGEQAYPRRVLMAEFPEGAGLIPNPVNRVAGFYFENHHFVPGFPNMAWPMMEWVLDRLYPELRDDDPPIELLLRVLGSSAESDLLEIMEGILAQHPQVQLSSLPFRGDHARPRHIELGIKGKRDVAHEAFAALQLSLAGDPAVQFEVVGKRAT